MALEGVRHRLQPVVGSEFLVDVVQMIPQRLRADAKALCNALSAGSRGKHPQDLQLLRRKGTDRRGSRDRIPQVGDLPRDGCDAAEDLFAFLLRADIPRQVDQKDLSRAATDMRNRGHVDPYSLAALTGYIQIEIRNQAYLVAALHPGAAFMAHVRSQNADTVQHRRAGLSQHLLGGKAKQDLGRAIPEAYLPQLVDCEARVRGIFEKGKQFRFQHVLIVKDRQDIERSQAAAISAEVHSWRGNNPIRNRKTRLAGRPGLANNAQPGRTEIEHLYRRA